MKKFNTNSNVYIIVYSTVMVVVVALLLAVAALMLWDLRRREKAGTLHVPEAGLPDGVQKGHR